MRMTATVVAVLLCATSALAEDVSAGRTQLSVFGSNLAFSQSTSEGSSMSGGLGIALSRAWSSRWSTEIAVSADRNRALATRFTVFPVDVTARYRFANTSRWTPYVFGGLRYVATPADPERSAFGFSDRTSTEIGVGTSLRITPHVSLRFDLNRLLRSDGVPYDPLTRGTIGVSWGF